MLFLAVSIIPLVVLALSSTDLINLYINQKFKSEIENKANLTKTIYNQDLKEYTSVILGLTPDVLLNSYENPSLVNEIENKLLNIPFKTGSNFVLVLDEENNVLFSPNKVEKSYKLQDFSTLSSRAFSVKKPVGTTEKITNKGILSTSNPIITGNNSEYTPGLAHVVAIPVLAPDKNVKVVLIAGKFLTHKQYLFGKMADSAASTVILSEISTDGNAVSVISNERVYGPHSTLLKIVPRTTVNAVLSDNLYLFKESQEKTYQIAQYYPLYNAAKDPVGLIYVGIPEVYFSRMAKNLYLVIGIMSVITLFLTVIIAAIFSRTITTPILRLSNGAKRISKGDLSTRVLVKGSTEINEMGKAFNYMATNLESTRKDLDETLEMLKNKNDKMRDELKAAGIVQKAILSHMDKPYFLDLHVLFKPHHSIGGDYFGLVNVSEDKAFLYCGDVSGKGVPAAILTGYLKNEFSYIINKMKKTGEVDPALVIEEISESALPIFTKTNQFTSAWCGLIDAKQQTLTFSAAGYEYPLVITDQIDVIDYANGPVVGVFEGVKYQKYTVPLDERVKFMLYTDGIIDQEVEKGKRIGREGLVERSIGYKSLEPREFTEKLVKNIMDDSYGFAQFDDILLITFKLSDKGVHTTS